LAAETGAPGAPSEHSRNLVRFEPLPGRYFCKLPAQPAVAFMARRGIIPDPYDANLAEYPHFSKEILMVSAR
jgi:hypothetical protein